MLLNSSVRFFQHTKFILYWRCLLYPEHSSSFLLLANWPLLLQLQIRCQTWGLPWPSFHRSSLSLSTSLSQSFPLSADAMICNYSLFNLVVFGLCIRLFALWEQGLHLPYLLMKSQQSSVVPAQSRHQIFLEWQWINEWMGATMRNFQRSHKNDFLSWCIRIKKLWKLQFFITSTGL